MKPSDVKWCENHWPLIDLRLYRSEVQDQLAKRGIPWLVTTECDMCPHKDWPRWERTSPETIERVARIEAQFPGLYFTDKRVPLKDALALMKQEKGGPNLFDSCDSGYCFI